MSVNPKGPQWLPTQRGLNDYQPKGASMIINPKGPQWLSIQKSIYDYQSIGFMIYIRDYELIWVKQYFKQHICSHTILIYVWKEGNY